MGKRSSKAKVVLSGTGAQSYRQHDLCQDEAHMHSNMAALLVSQGKLRHRSWVSSSIHLLICPWESGTGLLGFIELETL